MSRMYEDVRCEKENNTEDSQIQQLIDYFQLSAETDASNDGFEYQNYIEFPDFSTYDWEDIEHISEIFDISLNIDPDTFPFGETQDISEDDRKEINNLNPKIKDLISEEEITYPTEEDVFSVIEEIFEENGVPFGTKYELEDASFPVNYSLFQETDDLDDFQLYDLDLVDNNQNNDVEVYRKKIENIISSFNETEDALIKKSLLFAAFSTNEAFIKAKISAKMPNLNTIIEDSYLTHVLKKEIKNNLQTAEGRKKLFNKYYSSDNIKLVQIDHHLRNVLAHDIDSPIVKGTNIIFTDYTKDNPDGFQRTCNMIQVLENLKEHPTLLYPNNEKETSKQRPQ